MTLDVLEADMTKRDTRNRSFSVELNSRTNLKNIAIANGSPEPVLIEGTIGALHHAAFLEGVIFEVVGSQGAIRLDLQQEEVCGIGTPPRKRAVMHSEEAVNTQ